MNRNLEHVEHSKRPVSRDQSHDGKRQHEHADSTGPAAAGPRLAAALKFVGRFAQLDFGSLGSSIQIWHRSADERWFAAETAVAAAIQDSGREREQEILLEQIAEVFRQTSWFRPGEPGAAIGAAEPSAQYVGTLAMLSLLVRDRLSPDQFELLYRPYADIIPERELDPE